MKSSDRLFLTGALLLLSAAVWIEPAGSWLGEPDEARYAEIPREMLAAGDFVTPRLDGVPYFEKPPLLYWCEAASFAAFGQTPGAARLPARVAAAGTIVALVAGVAAVWGVEAGLAAAIFYLLSPLGFVLSRLNVTDGLLTFFFTATLFAARQTMRRREESRPWIAWSALAGLAAAGGFLSKGLVAIVLPGGILLVWCLLTRKTKSFRALLLSPTPLVFLAVSAPWFLLAERRNPGFLDFFFIHEHFQRFATKEAHRAGPIGYFVGIFLAGFLPGVPFFFSALRKSNLTRRLSEEAETLFFVLWFSIVFVFFSISSSKLPPYLLPAFPAAAALAGRAAGSNKPAVWRVSALFATLLALGVAAAPTARLWIADYGLFGIALASGAVLIAASWAACRLARRNPSAALAALALAWFGFYAGAALAWPRVPPATELHDLAVAARLASESSGAIVVGYRAYVQGLPWELKKTMPLYDYVGELEPQFERDPAARAEIFWSRDRFWKEWNSARKLIAVLSPSQVPDFANARVLHRGRKYDLIANY